ncbi:MAG: hypothetical protein ACJ74O_06160 [Frankiaceae bacterium]
MVSDIHELQRLLFLLETEPPPQHGERAALFLANRGFLLPLRGELLHLLHAIGFISFDEKWRNMRWLRYYRAGPGQRVVIWNTALDKTYRQLLEAIRAGEVDDDFEAIAKWFRECLHYGSSVAERAARTFQHLGAYEHNNYDRSNSRQPVLAGQRPAQPPSKLHTDQNAHRVSRGLTVVVQLPATDNVQVHRAVWAAYRDVFGSAPPLFNRTD